jgi:hypothetical protein
MLFDSYCGMKIKTTEKSIIAQMNRENCINAGGNFMADLKTLLGDKYKDGMTIDELMALEVEEPQQIDMSKFVSKELYDKAASDTANYKKQLKASMSEAEQKAMADAEERKAIQEELEKLRAEKTIAENSKGLIALGYDDKTANEVATAFMNGDFSAVIAAQAKFLEVQKKEVLATAVKDTPAPPVDNGNSVVMTKEKLQAMSVQDRLEFSQKNPEEYKKIYGG